MTSDVYSAGAPTDAARTVASDEPVRDRLEAAVREIEGLRTALITQRTIGQATGILMERFDLTADVAFDVMRRLSSHSNVQLRRIAQGIVETRTVPTMSALSSPPDGPDLPHPFDLHTRGVSDGT